MWRLRARDANPNIIETLAAVQGHVRLRACGADGDVPAKGARRVAARVAARDAAGLAAAVAGRLEVVRLKPRPPRSLLRSLLRLLLRPLLHSLAA